MASVSSARETAAGLGMSALAVRGLTPSAGRRNIARYALAVLLAAVAGCSSLPTIVPDMEMRRDHPVQLEGARGPLTAAQSKAVLDRLKSGGEDTNIFDRHMALEAAIAGSPLMVGNRIVLLQDGKATFAALLAAIRDAKDHINMETYTIEDDEVGNRFADALIEKQIQGVQVNLIYDSVGAINAPKAFFKRLTDSGVNVLEFNPINPLTAKKGWNVTHRDHRKLLIVDGQTAFLGGVNISSVYSGGSFAQRARRSPEEKAPWRDTHMQVDGPVVGEFQKLFLATWEKQKGEALAPRNYLPQLASKGKEVVRAIGSSPDEPYTLMYATLISAISSAETGVYLTNAYFVPDPQLLAALKDAAQRRVEVKMILPSYSDSAIVFHTGRSFYTELLEVGVKIYERRNRLLHAKTVVVDGVWSTIGSTNLDWRSFLHNDEVNAVILGQEFGAQMQAMFEKDLANSNAITLEQWNGRSMGMRLKEMAARLWQRAL
jgi:cardiolipin synthase